MTGNRYSRRWVAMVALTVLMLVPLLWTYFTWSWQDGHYQYFPLLLAFIAALYWERWSSAVDQATAPVSSIVVLGAIGLGGLVCVGYLLFSGLIGIIAASFAVGLITYTIAGMGGLRAMTPVLCLLFLAIPLPLDFDKTLIFQMQILASHLASLLLDGAGIMHVREGVILITEQTRYMTEEACSGVRSLFSSMAVVATYGVAVRHRAARVLTNVVQAVFWVILGNAVRVTLTVVLADHVSPWYASGTGHELLSLGVFAFILLMVASTDQFIVWLAETRLKWNWSGDLSTADLVIPDSNSETMESKQRFLRFPKRKSKRPSFDDGLEPVRTRRKFRLTGRKSSLAMGDEPMIQQDGSLLNRKMTMVAIGTGFLLITIFGGFITLRRISNQPSVIESSQRLPATEADDLPAELVGWKRVGFQHEHRDSNPLLATDSYMYTFQKGSLGAVISVDCPWNEWHNLNVCYLAQGWETEPDFFKGLTEDADRESLTYSEIAMTKKPNQSGRVYFTVVDRNRRDVRSSDWRRILFSPSQWLDRIASTIGETFSSSESSSISLPATTIQLYTARRGEYNAEELEELRSLFFAARAGLLESRRWK